MPIMRRSGGAWQEIDHVYTFGTYTGLVNNKRRRVYAAYYYKKDLAAPLPVPGTPAWDARPKVAERHRIFDFSQRGPAMPKLTGTNNGHTEVTLHWTVDPAAGGYRIYMRDGTATTATTSSLILTGASSYVWSGLKADHTYHFTITKTNDFGIESVESPPLHFASGHPAITTKSPNYPTPTRFYVDSGGVRTWLPTGGGSTGSWAISNIAQQGYPLTGKGATTRARGCIAYHTIRTQLVNQLTAGLYKTTPALAQPVVDHLDVYDAFINRLYRLDGGSGTPQVNVYPSYLNYSSNVIPVGYSGLGYAHFIAPAELAVKDNFKLTATTAAGATITTSIRDWAREWVLPVRDHNGLIFYRGDDAGSATAGYAGYCRFRGIGAAYECRLVLDLRWSFISTAYLAPKWS